MHPGRAAPKVDLLAKSKQLHAESKAYADELVASVEALVADTFANIDASQKRVNEYLQEARGIGEKDMQLLDELIDETVDVCNAQIDEAATRILREMGVNADGTRAMCYDEWKSNFNASHAVGNVRADAKKMVVEYQMENKEENGADGGVECISNRTVVKGSSESNEADDVKDLD